MNLPSSIYKKTAWNFWFKYIGAGLLLCLIFTGCKRVVHQSKEQDQEQTQAPVEPKAISKTEFQNILNLKLPLKTVLIEGKYRLTIPARCTYKTTTYTKEDLSENERDTIGLNKFELLKLKNGYTCTWLSNAFNANDLYSEVIYIIPSTDSTAISINDFKEEDAFVYYEDDNNIINDDHYIQATHIEYSQEYKSYICYEGLISWSKEYPKADKVNLCAHFLKHAKNLTNRQYPDVSFSNWEDYVQNMPTLETKIARDVFKTLEKELKIFMEEGEVAEPHTADNYPFVILYRPTGEDELTINHFFKEVKQNGVKNSSELSADRTLLRSTTWHDLINLKEANSCYYLQYTAGHNDETSSTIWDVICPMSYNDKFFFLKNSADLNEAETDFFAKMFTYFSQHYTLNVNQK